MGTIAPPKKYAWHTFYGVPTDVYGTALDGSGNVYVTGRSGASWTGPSEQPPLNDFGSDTNIFV